MSPASDANFNLAEEEICLTWYFCTEDAFLSPSRCLDKFNSSLASTILTWFKRSPSLLSLFSPNFPGLGQINHHHLHLLPPCLLSQAWASFLQAATARARCHWITFKLDRWQWFGGAIYSRKLKRERENVPLTFYTRCLPGLRVQF